MWCKRNERMIGNIPNNNIIMIGNTIYIMILDIITRIPYPKTCISVSFVLDMIESDQIMGGISYQETKKNKR